MSQINGLIKYIRGVQKDLGVTVILKDFIGFLAMDQVLFAQFQEFYIHQSDYCMSIKEQEHLWHRCLHGKELIYEKLKRAPQAYYGECYAGIGEYIIPMLYRVDNEVYVVGAVTIGGFRSDRWQGIKQKLKSDYNVQGEHVEALYDKAVEDNMFEIEGIKEKAEVISEYMVMLYAKEIEVCLRQVNETTQSHNYIIGHAIAYLKMHYMEEVKLRDVANFCHCSPSFISHRFKKMTGKTIKGYVNELRIEKAKGLIGSRRYSMTDIAFKVGYKDSNYFSKVFKDLTGVSPLGYQK